MSSKNLKEVVVKAQRGWFEGEKAVFIPTRNEKNTSNTPEQLVDAMNLPMIIKNGDNLTNLAGQELTYFINGVPADKIDIATFWTKYAKRVEYIESPSDPTFQGAQAVINIVMPEFTAGGITKFDVLQKFPNYGSYQTSTIVKHRRMSFGALVEGRYYRDHRSTSTETESFRNLYYDDTYYPEITREDSEHSWSRDNNMAVTLNARYRDSKFRATHTLTYNWFQNPGDGSQSNGLWSPTIFNSPVSSSSSYSNTNTYGIKGEYNGTIGKWAIGGSWDYSYGRIFQNSESRTASLSPIRNITREDAHALNAKFFLQYHPAKMWYLILNGSDNARWHSTDYSGSENVGLHQSDNMAQSWLRILWVKHPGLQAFIEPGIVVNSWKTGGSQTKSQVSPSIKLLGYYVPSSRWNLTQTVDYFARRPSINETADITIRESELMWVRGNPAMKSYYTWSSNTAISWIPSNLFSASASLSYSSSHHLSFPIYEPNSPTDGGMIKTWAGGGSVDHFIGGLNMSWRLFKKITLSVTPQYRYSHFSLTSKSLSDFRISARASARVGNVNAQLWWESQARGYSMGGYQRYKQNGALCLQLTYGTGDWYFSLRADDLINNRKHWKSWYDSEFYSLNRDQRLTGRTVSINISYSFGYGLKVKDDLSISSGSDASSAVVGRGAD